MNRVCLVALVMLITVPVGFAQKGNKNRKAPAEASEEILASYERSSWEAVKRKNYAGFASVLAPDFYDIFSNGQVVNKTELLQNYIRGVDLIDYSLQDLKVIMLNPEAAIVVYRARAHGTENQAKAHDLEKGKITEIYVAVTSGWAKRNGRWLNVFYRENNIR